MGGSIALERLMPHLLIALVLTVPLLGAPAWSQPEPAEPDVSARDLIEDGEVLFCSGKLEEGADEPAMLLDEVMSLSDALRRFRGGLELKVAPTDRHKLAQLRQTCDRHPGENPLFFQALGEDGLTRRVRASKERSVAISEELAGELCELLGHDRVGIVRL